MSIKDTPYADDVSLHEGGIEHMCTLVDEYRASLLHRGAPFGIQNCTRPDPFSRAQKETLAELGARHLNVACDPRLLPEATLQFISLLDKMKKISLAKSHDYAGSEDPMSNFRQCEAMGLPAWKGIVVRLTDKLSRIQNFCKKEALEVKDESIEDTLIDMANYALLCIIMYRETKREKEI